MIKRREYENDSKYNSGDRVNEYLLVLSPHEELRNKIIKVKEEFSKKYPQDAVYKTDQARRDYCN